MPIASLETAGKASLIEYVSKIREIWDGKDVNRSLHDIWLHAIRHASGIAEEVRLDRPVEILDQLSHFLLWVLTFAGRARGSLGVRKPGEQAREESLYRLRFSLPDVIWGKYPYCCPVCAPLEEMSHGSFSRRACECTLSRQKTIEERHRAVTQQEMECKKQVKQRRIAALRTYAKDHSAKRPRSIDAFQRMFESVFRANIERMSMSDIALHLTEEVGEVGDALLDLYTYHGLALEELTEEEIGWRQTELEDEIADVFSWIFALVVKLDQDRENVRAFLTRFRLGPHEIVRPSIRLSEILWWTYGSNELGTLWCKHCKDRVCKCHITFVTTEAAVSHVRSLMSP